MLRLLLLSIPILFFTNINAQDSDILTQVEGKLTDAKVTVDKLCANVSTSKKASSWYLKSHVYTEIAKSEVYKSLIEFPAKEALVAVKKCKELDTEGKLYSELITVLLDLGPILYNKGINNYNNALQTKSAAGYRVSLDYFNEFFEVLNVLGNDKKFIDQFIKFHNINPDKVYLYCGYAENQLENNAKAKEYYLNLIDLKSDKATALSKSSPLAFLYYTEILIKEGDATNAIIVNKRGVDLYPKDAALVTSLINIYKRTESIDELSVIMVDVVKNNPNDINLIYTLAKTNNSLAKLFTKRGYKGTADKYTEESIKMYKKGIALNPKDKNVEFKFNFNLGVLYFNKAARAYKADYENRQVYVDLFTNAMPYLEKCHSLNDKKRNVMNMLMKIYQTLEMPNKAAAIESKMY